MSKITGNEMAFPMMYQNDDKIYDTIEGLSKRELFAVMAMQGFCANPEVLKVMTKKLTPEESGSYLALASVEQADLLITELNKS